MYPRIESPVWFDHSLSLATARPLGYALSSLTCLPLTHLSINSSYTAPPPNTPPSATCPSLTTSSTMHLYNHPAPIPCPGQEPHPSCDRSRLRFQVNRQPGNRWKDPKSKQTSKRGHTSATLSHIIIFICTAHSNHLP